MAREIVGYETVQPQLKSEKTVKLEQLTSGVLVKGLLPNKAVTLIHAIPRGQDSVTVIYRDDTGTLQEEVLNRSHEATLELATEPEHWQFDGDGRLLKLVTEASPSPTPDEPERKTRRFYGVVELDAKRVGRDAGKIADAVIQHLAGQMGAKVKVVLDIQADLPEGASDDLIRTVTENANTLKFEDFGFEEM